LLRPPRKGPIFRQERPLYMSAEKPGAAVGAGFDFCATPCTAINIKKSKGNLRMGIGFEAYKKESRIMLTRDSRFSC
jgi:hypothetical protein